MMVCHGKAGSVDLIEVSWYPDLSTNQSFLERSSHMPAAPCPAPGQGSREERRKEVLKEASLSLLV